MNRLHSTRLLVSLILSLAFILFSSSLIAAEAPGGGDKKQAVFDRLISDFAKISAGIDNTQFDQEALIEKLDYDADTIIGFVTNEIVFQIYPGLLRGPNGTLIARSGNSLDQSVLLASLLNTAGYDARIARTKLNGNSSRHLLAQSIKARAPLTGVDDEKNKQVFKDFCSDLKIDCTEILAQYDQSANLRTKYGEQKRKHDAEKDFLLSRLENAGIKLSNGDSELLEREASDYFWVQYRIDAAGPWNNANPSMAEPETAFRDLKPTEIFTGQVPPSLLHQLTITPVIEQLSSGKTIVKNIGEPLQMPVANLSEKTLTFSIISSALMGRPEGSPLEPKNIASDLFLPSIGGSAGAQAFDIYGNTYPADAALSSYAGVFKTLNTKLRGALGALDGLSTEPPALIKENALERLKKVKLVYTYTAPSLPTQTHERILFDSRDLFDSRNKDQAFSEASILEAYKDLTKIYTFHTQTGRSSPSYFLETQLQLLTEKLQVWKMMVEDSEDDKKTALGIANVDSNNILAWMPLSLLSVMFDGVSSENAQLAYRPIATIVAHHRTLPFKGELEQAIDIIQNDRRSVVIEDGVASISRNKVLEAGVWDTLMEQELLSQLFGGASGTQTTMEAARNSKETVYVLKNENDPNLKKFPDSEVKNLLTADLKNGYVVVSPILDQSDANGKGHWWRINPKTGHVLGINSRGEGGAVTTRVVLKTIAISLLATIILCHDGTTGNFSCLGFAPAIGGAYLTGAYGAGYYTFGAVMKALQVLSNL